MRPDIRSQFSGLFPERQIRLPSPNSNASKLKRMSSVSSQTEFAIRIKRKPSLAEIHTLSLYNLTGEERQKHLKILMSDDCYFTEYTFDPCIEFIKDVRKSSTNSSNYAIKRSIGSQTFFAASDLIPSVTSDSHQTQTDVAVSKLPQKEEKLRELYKIKTNEKPKQPTLADINNIPKNKYKSVLTGPYTEFQSIPEWKDIKSRSGLKFDDVSLFSVIDSELSNKKTSLYPNDMGKLAHSTCELTSVVKNSTDVSSKAMNKNSREKFSLQINIPSSIQNMNSRRNSKKDLEDIARGQELKKYKRNQSTGSASNTSNSGLNSSSRTLSNSSNINYLSDVSGTKREHLKSIISSSVSSGRKSPTYTPNPFRKFKDDDVFESNPKKIELDNSAYYKPTKFLVDKTHPVSVSKSEGFKSRLQSSSAQSLTKPLYESKLFGGFTRDSDENTLIDVDFDSYNNQTSPKPYKTDRFQTQKATLKDENEKIEETIDVDFSIYDQDISKTYEPRKVSFYFYLRYGADLYFTKK